MKIKRLIALSAMAAALASGAALAQDNHYDGSWHHPAAWQDQQGPSLQNRNKDSREDQIRKQRERDEKIRKQREKEKKNASNGKRKNVSGLKPTAKRKSRISTTRISSTGLISKQASDFEGE